MTFRFVKMHRVTKMLFNVFFTFIYMKLVSDVIIFLISLKRILLLHQKDILRNYFDNILFYFA